MIYLYILSYLSTQILATESITKKIICIQESEGNQTSECSNCGRYGMLTSNLSQLVEDNTELKFCNSQTKLFDLIHIDRKANVSLNGFSYNNHIIMARIQCQKVRDRYTPGNGAGFRFTNISRLQIANLSFIGCGAIHKGSTILNNSKTMDFLASIYIYYSVNVLIRQIKIEDGNGTGLAIIDTTGYVEVSYSFFKNNSIKGNTTLSGGRGIYVDFTYCPPGTVTGCEIFNKNNKKIHLYADLQYF